MGKMIDLTGMLENGLWGYHELPGNEQVIPRVEVMEVANIAQNRFFSSRITICTISGTYLEAGSHILPKGKNLDEYSIERFFRPVKIVHLPEQKPKVLIDADLLEKHAPKIDQGDALIIHTGWDRMWNKPGYVLQGPNMRRNALEWVLEQRISILGVDIPCIEASWSEDNPEEKGGFLGALFGQDILLLAPLVNLDQVSGSEGQLICLPMKVKGTSGAPVRVIFLEKG